MSRTGDLAVRLTRPEGLTTGERELWTRLQHQDPELGSPFFCLELIESVAAVRPDLEIAVIERFMPRQLGEAEIAAAVDASIGELGAGGLKDIGRVMAALKARHAGSMDFAKASALVRQKLGG